MPIDEDVKGFFCLVIFSPWAKETFASAFEQRIFPRVMKSKHNIIFFSGLFLKEIFSAHNRQGKILRRCTSCQAQRSRNSSKKKTGEDCRNRQKRCKEIRKKLEETENTKKTEKPTNTKDKQPVINGDAGRRPIALGCGRRRYPDRLR